MSTVTKIAQYDDGKGLKQANAIRIANGGPITNHRYLQRLNTFLREAGIKEIEFGSSIKGKLLSNKEFDSRLVLSDAWRSEKHVYPVWTGTLVAFKENGAKLGDVIRYNDSGNTYFFEVPKEYQNERNAALAVDHGFLADGRPLIIPTMKKTEITYNIADPSQIELLQRFPSGNGWYNADNKFGIPLGEEIPPDRADARYFFRIHNYVGLLVRGPYLKAHRHIAWSWPSQHFGALMEVDGASIGAQKTIQERKA